MYKYKLIPILAQYSQNPDLPLNEWKFVGGKSFFRQQRFKELYPDEQFPEYTNKCICGRTIKDNSYLRNVITNKLVIVGDKCLQNFLKYNKSNHICVRCGDKHNNRSDEWCSLCRGGVLKVGLYKNKSFRWVMHNHPRYCKRLMHVYPCESLQQFVNWLQDKNRDKNINSDNNNSDNNRDKNINCDNNNDDNSDKNTNCDRFDNNNDDNSNKNINSDHNDNNNDDNSDKNNSGNNNNKDDKNVNVTRGIKRKTRENIILDYDDTHKKKQKILNIIDFGKHRNKTYEWVKINDPDYCKWALSIQITGNRLTKFKDWLKNN